MGFLACLIAIQVKKYLQEWVIIKRRMMEPKSYETQFYHHHNQSASKKIFQISMLQRASYVLCLNILQAASTKRDGSILIKTDKPSLKFSLGENMSCRMQSCQVLAGRRRELCTVREGVCTGREGNWELHIISTITSAEFMFNARQKAYVIS